MTPNQAFHEHFKFHRTTRFSESISAKQRKDWLSKDRHYRITWRSFAFGIKVPPGYYALIYKNSKHDHFDGYWDHADKRGLYKTLNSAITACMKAEKLEITKPSIRTCIKKGKKRHMTTNDLPALELVDDTSRVEVPKRRGRPKGSKNTKTRSDKGVKRGSRSTNTSENS
jgi:hypothetical protein